MVKRIWHFFRKPQSIQYQNLWTGDYKRWEEAQKDSSGYDDDTILQKVKTSTLRVINGEALFESDSVLFYEPDYHFALISILLNESIKNSNHLNLVDFGGALGSLYFQLKPFLESLNNVQWSVIEQQGFVRTGKEFVENDTLKFYYNITECMEEKRPHIALFSSVLSYIEQPYKILEEFISLNFKTIIIDRNPVFDLPDRITLQKVPEDIYQASYPSRIFNEKKMIDFFISHNYILQLVFKGFDPFFHLDEHIVNFKGYVFTKKSIL